MRRLLFGLAGWVLLTGCANRPAPAPGLPPAEAALVGAMTGRLAIAREVAWIKYRQDIPIRDANREVEVLDAVTARGSQRGLDPALVRTFFAAQIAASCAQQEKLTHLWRRGNSLPTYAPRTLPMVRVNVDAANEAILDAMAAMGPTPKTAGLRAAADRALRQSGVYWMPARIATAPLPR